MARPLYENIGRLSWVTWSAFWVFTLLKAIFPPYGDLKHRSDWQEGSKLETGFRAIVVEVVAIAWFVLLLSLFALLAKNLVPTCLIWFVAFIAGLRLVDIIQTSVNVVLFDRLRDDPARPHPMASLTRTLLLTSINFFELILLFAVVYLSYPENVVSSTDIGDAAKAATPCDALYFSVITQLTIGYGDLKPVGWGRLVASIQGIVGFIFVILVLARFISSLPQITTVLGDGPTELGNPKSKSICCNNDIS
ncbi:Ion channel [Symmachiella macrocystis]|uniref:Ion channel n=1 Tax=Symmachiella macrocystis TaxID=2527985 RepID=A0A5C6BKJ1_9PLAN|nr:potassium channel family protein [Symmachiella macrocystis]TWU12272.1 Ion channel [Symmachiella macrocystis]